MAQWADYSNGGGGGGGGGAIGQPIKLGVNVKKVQWRNEKWVQFTSVASGGMASLMGLQANDLIKRINDVVINNLADFVREMLNASRAGGNLEIKYRRPQGNNYTDGVAAVNSRN